MKPKILIILENRWGYQGKLNQYTHGVEVCNRRNLTFSRILPYFEDKFEIRFGQTTPMVATNPKQKFPVDREWIVNTVKSQKWFAVIVMSSKARGAMNRLGLYYDFSVPHPAAWGFKKETMIKLREFLLNKKK